MRRRGWKEARFGYQRIVGADSSAMRLFIDPAYSCATRAGSTAESWRGGLTVDRKMYVGKTAQECARKLEEAAEKWLRKQADKLKAELEKENS